MKFDFESLMELANEFDKKAEQLLETAASIRETANMMTAGSEPTRAAPAETPTETPTESDPDTATPPIVVSPPPRSHFPTVTKTEPDENVNSTPRQRIPKQLVGKTKLTALERLIMQSLKGSPKGIHKSKILAYTKNHGKMGTPSSVTGALVKLKKMGLVKPTNQATYALTNPLPTN